MVGWSIGFGNAYHFQHTYMDNVLKKNSSRLGDRLLSYQNRWSGKIYKSKLYETWKSLIIVAVSVHGDGGLSHLVCYDFFSENRRQNQSEIEKKKK